ncbi:MAG: MurT ligase domain-containing protein [Solirubrobacteraceae bacterium]
MLTAKLAAARSVGVLARRAGRGGTSLPGKVLVRLEPHAIGMLAGRLEEGSVLVSATNGKTTTAGMAAAVLEGAGTRLVHNRAGANMAGGVATALLQAAVPGDGIEGELGLFEVDELWLPRVAEELAPRAMLLANLFRDQLDRYGELEAVAARWGEVVAAWRGRTAFVLNADDPLVADLGRDVEGVTYYGIEDDRMALPALQHASDSKHCRRCGHAYAYEAAYLAHLGRYACPSCGARRPAPSVVARDIELDGVRSASFTLQADDARVRVDLPLPGLYNVYNALGAAALCHALGVPAPAIAGGLERVHAAFGRSETIVVGGRPVAILLVKNPAGANEVLRTLALESGELDLLAVLNDGVADGRDVSWIWDADMEVIVSRVRRATCSGARAAELALRLKYAGLAPDRIVVEPSLGDALDRAVADGEDGAALRPLYALPNYTALLSLRGLLAERGLARKYWER